MEKNRQKLINSLWIPCGFVVSLWIVEFVKNLYDFDLSTFGILPLKIKGLIGILTAPLIHSGYSHLISNSFPLFFLGVAMFYFYRELAYKVFFIMYFATNTYVWLFARNSWHIGASGLVYGLFAFLFVSGVIRRNTRLAALSMLIIFVYGSMVWGMFPHYFLEKNISWESHLMGFVIGVVLALYFRKEGPQKEKYEWEDELDEEDIDKILDEYVDRDSIGVRYFYKNKK